MGEEQEQNFIHAIIQSDVAAGRYGGEVVTRFPPEPNGYLHIGHAKSICLNFGAAAAFGGRTHLRFDDTNPTTEESAYARAIEQDVRWLGFEWDGPTRHASDYFDQFYAHALALIEAGLAYVDSLTEEEIRDYRGTVTEPGRPSPYRDRAVAENLDLFRRMQAGEFAEGTHVLRAKIDMASANMKMRDPILYRILHAPHYRTGEQWKIYPMYDYAHPLSDAIEGVTHSICTLEFENNRELYDWVLDHTVQPPRPHQHEFGRLALTNTVVSKRKLLRLVEEGHVDGWDDPRMPTLAALRRRGVPAAALREFCERIGVARTNSRVDVGRLEHTIRDLLNPVAPRVMAVLRPLRVVITNYPEGESEWLDAPYFPRDVDREGSRRIPFSRDLLIERDDFMREPARGYRRLAPGREVRLRYGFIIRCQEVIEDDAGQVVALHCTYDPETRGGNTPDGRKVRGTIHWLSAGHALPAEVRLYDRLFSVEEPEAGEEDFTTTLNPDSMIRLTGARVEPSVGDDLPGTRYQFERQGYFWKDPIDSGPEHLVFNRIVPLRDSWTKQQKRPAPPTNGAQRPAAVPTPAAAVRDPVEALTGAQRERHARYTGEYGLDRGTAAIVAGDETLAALFESAAAAHDNPVGIANWLTNDYLAAVKEGEGEPPHLDGGRLAELVALIDRGTITSRIARELFVEMLTSDEGPAAMVQARGLTQLDDEEALRPLIERVVARHPDEASRYRAGNAGLIGYFVGQVMRESDGRANPQLAGQLLRKALDG